MRVERYERASPRYRDAVRNAEECDYGGFLKKWRTKLHMTRAELAHHCTLHPTWVTNIEHNLAMPGRCLKIVARALLTLPGGPSPEEVHGWLQKFGLALAEVVDAGQNLCGLTGYDVRVPLDPWAPIDREMVTAVFALPPDEKEALILALKGELAVRRAESLVS